MWREISSDLPHGCKVFLSDLSEGMVREAAAGLCAQPTFEGFPVADAAALPFHDRSFDVIVANHMLYHVPQRQQALAEFNRVLKNGGQFVASTNGSRHLLELRQMADDLLPNQQGALAAVDACSSLENGVDQLTDCFSSVEVHRYDNELLVTGADDILRYILSSSEAKAAVSTAKLGALRSNLVEKIEAEGAVRITVDSGFIQARRK
jgi:ubiquinone/menaquinone biosynthesis C-methylase UbiE